MIIYFFNYFLLIKIARYFLINSNRIIRYLNIIINNLLKIMFLITILYKIKLPYKSAL